MKDPLDFSEKDDPNDRVYRTWYNGYFCTKCKKYQVSACTPDLPTPRLAEHMEQCGINHFWWTDNPHSKIPAAIRTLTEVGVLAFMVKFFKKIDQTEEDFKISQEAIQEMTRKLGGTMQILEEHQRSR